VTSALFAQLPPNLQKIRDLYSPAGPLSLTLQFQRQAGKWRKHSVVMPQNMTITYAKFRYPLERLQGTLDHVVTSDQVETIKVDLAGYTGTQKVTIQGEVNGDGPTCGVDLLIRGENIPLDSKLQAALSPEHQRIACSFHPTGLGNFDVFVHRERGSREFTNRYLIRFHHVCARYDIFPYPLENVSGVLDIQEGWWEFREFRGTHKGCEVVTRGRSEATARGDRLKVDIQGTKLLLDDELRAALKPEWQTTWKTLAPTGRMDFVAYVDQEAKGEPKIDLTIRPRDVSLMPAFFPYALSEVTGTARYENHWVLLKQLHAHHGSTELSLDGGKIFCKPRGGVLAEIDELKGDSVVPDEDFLRALPKPLRKAAECLQLRNPLAFKTKLTVDLAGPDSPPDVYWDAATITLNSAHLHAGVSFDEVSGHLGCRGRFNGRQLDGVIGNLKIDEARVFGQPLQGVQGEFEVKREAPERLVWHEVRARVFGGEVYGPLWIDFGQPVRYEMNLTASRLRLEEFGQLNLGRNAKIEGLATARLFLRGEGDTLAGLEGRGSLEVPNGKMYNLPLLLELLKVLQLRSPDRTAFDEAYATFDVQGPRVSIQRLDLYGNAISLGGQGEMNLDSGAISLDFYAVWGRVVQMLPPLLGKIPPVISKQLLKVKMRGSIGDVRFEKEPVPNVVEPVKRLLERLRK
jgi:hypothetical protein